MRVLAVTLKMGTGSLWALPRASLRGCCPFSSAKPSVVALPRPEGVGEEEASIPGGAAVSCLAVGLAGGLLPVGRDAGEGEVSQVLRRHGGTALAVLQVVFPTDGRIGCLIIPTQSCVIILIKDTLNFPLLSSE